MTPASWFWFDLRRNAIEAPLNPALPNVAQRVWMRVVFGMVAVTV